jgi:hypothetical protein
MPFRWINAVVVLLWLISMSWLISQKVAPPMMAGNPPDYQSALPLSASTVPPEPVCWRVAYRKKSIGLAASQALPTTTGAEMRSITRLENLPVSEMLRGLLGNLAGRLLHDSFGRGEFAPNMNVATRLRFDHAKRLSSFESVIDVDDYPRIIRLQGDVDVGGKMRLTATVRVGDAIPVVHRQEIVLPADVLVADALSPRSELRGLRLGQKWTMPSYRPFPPNSPVQIISAAVEESEVLRRGEELVQTLVVVYREDAGSGLGAADAPMGRAWVDADGAILRQEVRLSNLKLALDRVPAHEAGDLVQRLADEEFDKLFADAPSVAPAK